MKIKIKFEREHFWGKEIKKNNKGKNVPAFLILKGEVKKKIYRNSVK